MLKVVRNDIKCTEYEQLPPYFVHILNMFILAACQHLSEYYGGVYDINFMALNILYKIDST